MIEQLKGSAWELFLEVRPSNTAALALYESLGFNQLGLRPRYYPGPKGGGCLGNGAEFSGGLNLDSFKGASAQQAQTEPE